MSPKSRAEAALLGLTLIWGGTFPIVKIGMADISPVLLIALRFTVAVAVILLLFRRRLFPVTRAQVAKGSVLGLFLFLGFVAQNIGMTITTASKSAFITGMMVIFVPLLQFVIERRAPRLGNLLGVAMVAAGLWFLTSPEGAGFNAGDALTLVCAVLFAVYIVYLDVVSREMTPAQLTFLQMATVCAGAWLWVAVAEEPRLAVTVSSVAAMLYLTFLATVFTTYLQTRYQKDTTPTRAVIIFSVEPVFAALGAYLLLGEQLGALGVLGGGLIIAGVIVSEVSDAVPILARSLDPGAP